MSVQRVTKSFMTRLITKNTSKHTVQMISKDTVLLTLARIAIAVLTVAKYSAIAMNSSVTLERTVMRDHMNVPSVIKPSNMQGILRHTMYFTMVLVNVAVPSVVKNSKAANICQST